MLEDYDGDCGVVSKWTWIMSTRELICYDHRKQVKGRVSLAGGTVPTFKSRVLFVVF